jgi:fumarate hydratase, class I
MFTQIARRYIRQRAANQQPVRQFIDYCNQSTSTSLSSIFINARCSFHRSSKNISSSSTTNTTTTTTKKKTKKEEDVKTGVVQFEYQKVFEQEKLKEIEWRKITEDFVQVIESKDFTKKKFLKVDDEAIRILTETAMIDIAHLLRAGHLKQLRMILDDEEASKNDKFVALELLKNACVAAGKVLPGCQDTGTAIVSAYRDMGVFTSGSDEEMISRGVFDAYVKRNLRYSQVAAQSMYEEKNTGSNLPAQIDLYATTSSSSTSSNKDDDGDLVPEYHFHFMAKGGGSANKTFLFQETKALLNPKRMKQFLQEKIKLLGTSACPPYHLAFVVGGLSAEQNLKTVKMASARYYDTLPTTGNAYGRAFRDLELEKEILEITREMGIGAQFGGKYFCHDVRVIRLPRHGASCPVGLGVSCSADRQAHGKITKDGVFIEQLEDDPAKYLPEVKLGGGSDDGENTSAMTNDVVKIDLNQPMSEVLKTLSKCSVATRLSLTGSLIVARDIAHAKLQERLNEGLPLPQYMKDHPVYYAGPAKCPEGKPSGSFGPTTAGRMDAYVDQFQKAGGSMIMLAKGNRSTKVTKACKENGGFYLGSVGGPAAILAQNNIKRVRVQEFEELGMEAIWKIDVVDFPAFVVVDDKGNDFFKQWQPNEY